MTGSRPAYYSQFGEDRLLEALFRGERHGICVEVGANNGVDGSTTLHFEELGWTCILVEPNPVLCRELRTRRKAQLFECAASSTAGTATLHVACGAEHSHAVSAIGDGRKAAQILKEHGFNTQPVEVTTRPMDDILDDAHLTGRIDFISIDVEGHELDLLKGFSLERWRPKILLVEDNAPFWDHAVRDHLKAQNYVRFRRTGVNDWYAHVSDKALAGPSRRLVYGLSMVRGRVLMALLRATTPIVPTLRRVPGSLFIADVLLGRRRRP